MTDQHTDGSPTETTGVRGDRSSGETGASPQPLTAPKDRSNAGETSKGFDAEAGEAIDRATASVGSDDES